MLRTAVSGPYSPFAAFMLPGTIAGVELTDGKLREIAQLLVQVPGVIGVTLGGSRARGDHTPSSDVDLGLYYRIPLDLRRLGQLAQQLAGPQARVTELGEWGPWVDGGAWLTIAGVAVDWIYRDVDRVRASWKNAQKGCYSFHAQVGHPLGVPDFSYAGELALGVVLADPSDELGVLQQQMAYYPSQLRAVLTERPLWEAEFLVAIARKAVPRGDVTYIAGCLFRVMGLCAHALHGHAGRWLINEKGAVDSAGRLPHAPPNFAVRAHGAITQLGTDSAQLTAALDAADELITDTTTVCRRSIA